MTNDLKTGGQTPTPRTDAVTHPMGCLPYEPIGDEQIVPADFARTLERELTEMKELLSPLKGCSPQAELVALRKAVAAHAEDRAMLETECRRLEAVVDRGATKLDDCAMERDDARDAMISYGLHNATLRQALKWSVDAMQTWFSSEYLEHPETRKCRKALDTTPAAYKAELLAEIERIDSYMRDSGGNYMEEGDSTFARVRNAIQDRERERNEALAQLDAARRDRDEAKEAMTNLQKQCFTLTTAESELAALRAELEVKIEFLNASTESYTVLLADYTRVVAERDTALAQLADLRAQLDAANAKLDSYRTHTL